MSILTKMGFGAMVGAVGLYALYLVILISGVGPVTSRNLPYFIFDMAMPMMFMLVGIYCILLDIQSQPRAA